MQNESDRPERRLEQISKAIEQRAQADQIAERHRQMDSREASAQKERRRSSESPSIEEPQHEKLDRGETRELQKRGESGFRRSADEVAAIRTSRPSEMRRDAAELWEAAHRRNYHEFTDSVARDKLRKSDQLESKMVWSDQIAPLSVTALEQQDQSETFWHHHDNGPDYYRKMGESYPKLHEQLKKGKTPKELANDPELKDTVKFWYGDPALKLEHFKDSYFCDESGHHRVALAHRYQLEEIPAQVREWEYKQRGEG